MFRQGKVAESRLYRIPSPEALPVRVASRGRAGHAARPGPCLARQPASQPSTPRLALAARSAERRSRPLPDRVDICALRCLQAHSLPDRTRALEGQRHDTEDPICATRDVIRFGVTVGSVDALSHGPALER